MAWTWTNADRAAIERAAQQTRDKRHWQRLRGLLLLGEGRAVAEVARVLGTTRQSLYNWRARYQEGRDPQALVDRPRSGRPPDLEEREQERLETLLRSRPEEHGYRAHGWTVPLLERHLARVWKKEEVGENALRRTLRRRGGRWKRPRYVLARRDPEREQKKGS